MYAISRKDGIGDTLHVPDNEVLDAAARLSNHGVYPVNVRRFDGAPPAVPTVIAAVPPRTPDADPAVAAAAARIADQHAALASAGVDLGGRAGRAVTQVAGDGSRWERKADKLRAAHDRAATAHEAGEALIAAVRAEGREDRTVTPREIAASLHVNGSIEVLDGFTLTDQAVRGLASRIDSPMVTYITGIRNRMVARESSNMGPNAVRDANDADRREIARVVKYECEQSTADPFVLRTRAKGLHGAPDVFACVSRSYGMADAPDTVPQLLASLPGGTKGRWGYDPASTEWHVEAELWTPTPAAEHAVGEAFRAFSRFGGRDNGTSSFRGGGGTEMLVCLNTMTHVCEDAGVTRAHRGRILYDIRRMIRGSLKSLEALIAAWGVNRARTVDLPTADDRPVPIEQAIPGFWSYLLKDRGSDLVGVLPGRTAAHVEGLTRAYFDERRDRARIVRSDFAQGWTRYVQDQPLDVRNAAERAMGDWFVSGKPVRYLASSN